MTPPREGGAVDHGPDSPFGCTVTWGEPLGGVLARDMLRHVCNRSAEHDGLHECKCGDRR